MKPISIRLTLFDDGATLCATAVLKQGAKLASLATQAKRRGRRAVVVELADALDLALQDFDLAKGGRRR